MSFIVLKSGQRMDDVVALSKGLIGPNDLANGGEMSPQQAAKLISLVAADTFLSKIDTVMMVRLERDVDAIDIGRRQLVRVPQGTEPSADQTANASEHGGVLRALPVQLFPTLKLDFLRANADNPKLVQALEKGFAIRLANDLVDLGFNGQNDTAEGATRDEKFLNLNKGWIKLAQESAHTKKLDIDPATDTWQATLGAIMDQSDDRWRETSTFVMNTADADAYARELGGHVTGTPLTADSPLRRYQGRPIEAHAMCPRGHVMFTPIKNLAHGIHKEVHRDKEYHKRRRCLEYTFDMAVDYEIGVKEALVLGQPGE
ncbi:MAG: P2 family phage major capsid protein [Pelagimonas sp.]|nr:P2 family phage major capsid protein [Pelagimonas sp.]